MTLEADFWAFASERDAIRLRRERGDPEPWTEDRVLRDYHITNVHRDLDPGTRWIVAQIRRRGLTEPDDLLFTIYAYRSLNRVQTFEAFGLPWRDEVCAATWVARLDDARRRGVPLGSKRHLTFWARVRVVLPRLVDCRELAEEVFAASDGVAAIGVMARTRTIGVGPFLGTQIVADLATVAPPGLSFGRDTAVPISGGSRFALKMIYGMLTPEEADRRAFDERSSAGRRQRRLEQPPEETALIRRLLSGQPPALSRPMTMIDLEHTLCEYGRYARLRSGDMTRENYMRRDV